MKFLRITPRKVIILASLIVLIVLIFLGITLLQVHKLVVIDDEIKYSKNFQPDGKSYISLDSSCNFLAIVCKGDQVYYQSPLFPHFRLETTNVSQTECTTEISNNQPIYHCTDDRYIHIDKFWKVFWIQIVQRTQSNKFFGPYRYAE